MSFSPVIPLLGIRPMDVLTHKRHDLCAILVITAFCVSSRRLKTTQMTIVHLFHYSSKVHRRSAMSWPLSLVLLNTEWFLFFFMTNIFDKIILFRISFHLDLSDYFLIIRFRLSIFGRNTLVTHFTIVF